MLPSICLRNDPTYIPTDRTTFPQAILRQRICRLASQHMATCTQIIILCISKLIQYRLCCFCRATADGFSKLAVHQFHPIQNREAIMLALALIKSPPTLEKHFHRHTSSIMFSVNYHLPPMESEDDPCVVAIKDHVQHMLHDIQPGTRLIEYLPWLRYIPSM